MLEPEEVARWERNARALGRKADDAEGLAQVLGLVDAFEDHAMLAISRLLTEGFMYGELARALPNLNSRQALRQRHERWLKRHQPVEPVAAPPAEPAGPREAVLCG